MRAIVAVSVLVAVLVGQEPSTVEAEHEVYYRYTILGYVTDAGGMPARGVRVAVVRDKTGRVYEDWTDADGLYVVVARLGDESAGETLTVTIGAGRTRVTARFQPTNHVDERGTRLDFQGTTWREQPGAFPATLARIVGPAR